MSALLAPGDRVSTEWGMGRVVESSHRRVFIQLDSGDTLNIATGTPGYNRIHVEPLAYCPADDLAPGACRTLGQCWGHECVGFSDCPCARCRHATRGSRSST